MQNTAHSGRILAISAAVLLLGACSPNKAPAPEQTATPAPELVALPDFSLLVERTSPAVVSIVASRGQTADSTQGEAGKATEFEQRQQEFFRRFFGQPVPENPNTPPAVSFGSGFIVSDDGYVLTNHHVIAGMSEIQVNLADRRKLAARLIGSDPSTDIAVLKIDAKSLPQLRAGDSDALKPGQWVVAIGSPFGFDYSVTAGIVSALGRPSLDGSQRFVPFIQSDVAINRGNSGGPLLNTRGEVVGVNSQIFSNSGGYMGVSFAIPIQTAMNAYNQIKSTGRVKRGQLGVQVREVQAEDLPRSGLKAAQGAFVERVLAGSAAAKAGIRPGDIITAFNGAGVFNSSDLPPLVGALKPGSAAQVQLLRNKQRLQLPVVLDALASDAAAPRR
jgi:serine protease Do